MFPYQGELHDQQDEYELGSQSQLSFNSNEDDESDEQTITKETIKKEQQSYLLGQFGSQFNNLMQNSINCKFEESVLQPLQHFVNELPHNSQQIKDNQIDMNADKYNTAIGKIQYVKRTGYVAINPARTSNDIPCKRLQSTLVRIQEGTLINKNGGFHNQKGIDSQFFDDGYQNLMMDFRCKLPIWNTSESELRKTIKYVDIMKTNLQAYLILQKEMRRIHVQDMKSKKKQKEPVVLGEDANLDQKFKRRCHQRLSSKSSKKINCGLPFFTQAIFMIFSLIGLSHQALSCPNKGRYVTYNQSDYSQTKIQYSFCQAKVKYQSISMDPLSYMHIQHPCIYEINNHTRIVVDSEKNEWYLYQYNNIMIEKGRLRYPFQNFIGVTAQTNRIIFQYQDSSHNLINNKTSTRWFSIGKLVNLIRDSLYDQLTVNKQFIIAHKLLDQQAGQFRWSISRNQYVLDDGFQNCQKIEDVIEYDLMIDANQFNQSDQFKIIGLNSQVLSFLKANQAYITTDYPQFTSSPRILQSRNLQVSDQDWNGLTLVKSDNSLINCKYQNNQFIDQDFKTKFLQSCSYRYLLETSQIGKIITNEGQTQSQLSIINSVAVEQYNLRPTQFDCLQSEPIYHYTCECFFKSGQNEFENYEQQADIPLSKSSNNNFLQSEELNTNYRISKKCFGQGGDGCILSVNPRGCVEQSEQLSDFRSKLYQIQKAGTCVSPQTISRQQGRSETFISPSLSMCSNQDSYNAVRSFYNNTIYSIQNNAEQITEDYIEAMQSNDTLSSGDYRSLNSKDYLLFSDFVNGICSIKLDGSMNILFPKRKFTVEEQNCRYDEANIKQLQDVISPVQNKTSGLHVFTRFTRIQKFIKNHHQFFPPQQGQKQIKFGSSTKGLLQMSMGSKVCSPQIAYCVNIRRFIDVFYCSKLDDLIDQIIVVDNGKDISDGRWILLTTQRDVVCMNIKNPDDTCDDIRFEEHAIRFIENVSIDGIIESQGLFTGKDQLDITAKACKINQPLQYQKGGINHGEICCANDGLLKFIIDDGNQQIARSVNTINKCYKFNQNAIFFKNLNYENLVIKLPNVDGIINQNSIFRNLDFSPIEFEQSIKPQFDLLPFAKPTWYAEWINFILLSLFIMFLWLVLNAIVYTMDLHYHVTQGGEKAPSLWYLMLGGGIINLIISALAKTKQYVFTRNQKDKLQIDDNLLKIFLQEQEAKKKIQQFEDIPLISRKKQ